MLAEGIPHSLGKYNIEGSWLAHLSGLNGWSFQAYASEEGEEGANCATKASCLLDMTARLFHLGQGLLPCKSAVTLHKQHRRPSGTSCWRQVLVAAKPCTTSCLLIHLLLQSLHDLSTTIFAERAPFTRSWQWQRRLAKQLRVREALL